MCEVICENRIFVSESQGCFVCIGRESQGYNEMWRTDNDSIIKTLQEEGIGAVVIKKRGEAQLPVSFC
jgi:hypothetical protein